jgi:hypothetical protein
MKLKFFPQEPAHRVCERPAKSTNCRRVGWSTDTASPTIARGPAGICSQHHRLMFAGRRNRSTPYQPPLNAIAHRVAWSHRAHWNLEKAAAWPVCRADGLGLNGDGQGELKGRGGEERAILCTRSSPIRFGGSNSRSATWATEVTQPRVVSYRVGIRMSEPRMTALPTRWLSLASDTKDAQGERNTPPARRLSEDPSPAQRRSSNRSPSSFRTEEANGQCGARDRAPD